MARRHVERIGWWRALRESELPSNARLLALALSTYMDPDGSGAFPSQQTLAGACGWSDPRSVRKALEVLQRTGYVEVERHAGPRRQGRAQATHAYRATVPDRQDQPDREGRLEHDQPEPQGREDATTNRPPGATNRPSGADQAEPQGRQPHQDLPRDPTSGGARPTEEGDDVKLAPYLDAIDRRLTRASTRALSGADRCHRRLLGALTSAAANGWRPGDLARAVTEQALDAERSLPGLIAWRVEQLGRPLARPKVVEYDGPLRAPDRPPGDTVTLEELRA